MISESDYGDEYDEVQSKSRLWSKYRYFIFIYSPSITAHIVRSGPKIDSGIFVFLSNLSRTLFFFYFLSSSHLHPQDDEEGGGEEEGDENSAGDIELYNLDIINDTDDEDVEGENTEKNNITSGVTKSVSVVDSEKKEKKKDQKFFWDKESNEKASKTVNEEDDYKWEDEVRFRFITVNLHKHYITLQ